MSDEPKRVDLRFGDVAISVRGFDDPVGPVKQVLRFVQRVVEETPELTKLSLALDDEDIAALVQNVSQQLDMRDGQLEITPGLIIAAKAAPEEAEMAPPEPAPPLAPPMPEAPPEVETVIAAPAADFAEEEDFVEEEPEPLPEYLETGSGPEASERIFEDIDPEPAGVSEESDELEAEAEAHGDFGAAIEPPYEAHQEPDRPEPEPEQRVINIFGDPAERRRAKEPDHESTPPLRRRPEVAKDSGDGGDPLSFLRRRREATSPPQEDPPLAEAPTNIFADPDTATDTNGEMAPVEAQPEPADNPGDWQEETPAPEISEPEPASMNIFSDNDEDTPLEPEAGELDRQSILRKTEPKTPMKNPEPSLEPGGAMPPPRQGSSRFEALVARYRRDPGQANAVDTAGGAMQAASPKEAQGDDVAAPVQSAGISAGDLARSAGATTVPELLAAAAAWLSVIKGQNRFARRDVMAVFDEIPGDHARSLEARIKGYGKLVRNGVLVLVDDGMFALSEDERERFKDLMG